MVGLVKWATPCGLYLLPILSLSLNGRHMHLANRIFRVNTSVKFITQEIFRQIKHTISFCGGGGHALWNYGARNFKCRPPSLQKVSEPEFVLMTNKPVEERERVWRVVEWIPITRQCKGIWNIFLQECSRTASWLSKLSTTADIIYVNIPLGGSNGDSFNSLGKCCLGDMCGWP